MLNEGGPSSLDRTKHYRYTQVSGPVAKGSVYLRIFSGGRYMLEEKVKAALEDVRPSLQADGGDVEFVSVSDDGVVSLKLIGACGSCPMSQMTLRLGIEKYLKKIIPEITSVIGV